VRVSEPSQLKNGKANPVCSIKGWTVAGGTINVRRSLGPPPTLNDLLRRVFATDSGMIALWEPQRFSNITDYGTWERELLEDTDISRHIDQGAFVPLNIHADGAYDCAIRHGTGEAPATLSDREQRFLTVSSEPYLFRSNGMLAISGLEYIGRTPGNSASFLALSSGDWTATIHLIDWTQEPGAKSKDGKPTKAALPDFVVLLNPSAAEIRYRMKVDTFGPHGRR